MAEWLYGGPASTELLLQVKEQLSGERPKLVMIGFEQDPAFISYAKSIDKMAAETGIRFETCLFPTGVSEKDFLVGVARINEDADTDGVVLSMPLPDGFSFEAIQPLMRPEKDVDGITLENRALLYEGRDCFYPCTAEAVLLFLKHYEIPVSGKHAVIVGRSPVVGRPVAFGLLAEDATVTICHTKTRDLGKLTREADILITGAGCPGLVTREMVKPGAIVLDLGMGSDETGKIQGDVDLNQVSEIASAVSPPLGGVGVLTTAILLKHTAEAYFKRK